MIAGDARGEPAAPEPRDTDLQGPPLPLVVALDLAVAALSFGSGRPGTLVVSGLGTTAPSEVLERVGGPITLIDPSQGGVAGDAEGATFARALWLAPHGAGWRAIAASLDRSLAHGGHLALISTGPLARPWSRVRPDGLGLPSGAMRAGPITRLLGYPTVAEWRLYGLRSAAWAVLRIAADRLGRLDLADRYEAAFRESLIEPGHPRLWNIGVWLGRKPVARANTPHDPG